MKPVYLVGITVLITLLLSLNSCKKEDNGKPIRFFLETRTPYPGQSTTPWTLPHSQMEVSTISQPILWEANITNIELVQVELGLCLLFEFDPAGGRTLYRLSVDQKGGRIVLVYNGKALGAVRLQEMLSQRQLLMFLEIADDELIELVKEMRVGLNLSQAEIGEKQSKGSEREESKEQLLGK